MMLQFVVVWCIVVCVVLMSCVVCWFVMCCIDGV